MPRNRRQIEAALEAQRFTASQASRAQDRAALVANAYQRWEELFQAGLYSEARRFWLREVEGN